MFSLGGLVLTAAGSSAAASPNLGAGALLQRTVETAIIVTSARADLRGIEGALVYLGGSYGAPVRVQAVERPPPAAPDAGSGGAIPPASAGTNGSYVAAAKAGTGELTARSPALRGAEVNGTRATYVGGIVLPPAAAPERIRGVINAANTIVGRPYVWGGGHSSWYASGYDCSGAVSFALAGGGFLDRPLDSGQLESWGAPGPGRWLTVYANAGHVYAVIAGFRWDTVGDARGSGPRWHPAGVPPAGFIARHPPGY